MKVELYQVDSFTDQLFGGNPAAVCLLPHWLDVAHLQAIARENNLTETAFLVANDEGYDIRCFTPFTELRLCGHATLAAAFIIFNYLNMNLHSSCLNSLSGPISILRQGESLSVDFAMTPYRFVDERITLAQVLGIMPREVYKSEEDYMVVLYREEQVRDFEPHFDLLAKLEARGVTITARGKTVDFVSRWFGPRVGANEDSVTASAHCMLVPYWSGQLGKTKLVTEQLSPRRGKVHCEAKNERVLLTGKAVLYLQGQLFI